MNISQKYLQKSPIFTFFSLIVLAASIAFGGIACVAWTSTNNQINSINSSYTTLAVPVPDDMAWLNDRWSHVGGLTKEDGNIYWADGTVTYSKEHIASVAENAPYVEQIYNSGFLSAKLLNCEGLASSSLDISTYNSTYDFWTYGACVLAVKCVDITDNSIDGYKEEGDTPVYHTGLVQGVVELEVIDCISLMESYGDLTGKHIFIENGPTLCNDDGSFALEVGKTYIIRGFFEDLIIRQQWREDENGNLVLGWFPGGLDGDVQRFQFTTYPISGEVDPTNENPQSGLPNFILERKEVPGKFKTYYYTAAENQLPFYAEYTGNWEDFFDTDAGQVWRDTIIPWAEMNQNSAAVVLTDNLESIYNFNSGSASILEGRAFSHEEYEHGANVCLVSAAFAQLNSLSVGDVVILDYYDTGISKEIVTVQGFNGIGDYSYQRLPMTQEARLGIEKEYEIIGIYAAPEFSIGQYNFNADTIFVPKASIANTEQYEEADIAYLNGLVLKNGTADDFETYMQTQGLGGAYQYADMSYTELLPALDTLAENALRLLCISLIIFAVVLCVCLFLFARRVSPVIHSMRLIGVTQREIIKELMNMFAVFFFAAACLGSVVGAALFSHISAAILSALIEFSTVPLLLSSGAELLVLLMSARILAGTITKKGLMQTKRMHK